MKYIIKDWAGNVLTFKGNIERPEFAVAMEFDSFDDAEDWLSERLGDEYEDARGEYYIEQGEVRANHGI